MKNYFFRCTAIFILILSLGVGTAWADEITVYVTGEIFIGTGEDAWDNATSTIKVDVRKGHPECFDCDDFNGLYNQDMTNTGYTYNGYPIYSYTLNQAGAQFRFKHYKSGVFKENYTTDWHSTTNQIYRGYYDQAHHWATYGRDVTFYATPKKMDGSKWKEGTHSLFANFKYGDGESEWKRQQMTKTAYTYNGDAIYTCTMLLPYNVIKNVQFLYNDGSDHDLYVYTPSPQLTANDLDGKILLGWNGSHNWVSYGRDVTIYTIPDYLFKDKGTPYDESIHYPAVCIQMGTGSTWNTVNMTKTSYTYATYPIYKATILIDQNKFWEYQIKYFKKSDNTQVDLYQFNQSEPKAEYAPSYIDDKLYHGWNGSSHDFFSYRYDVALDMQSGGGGSTSIIAIDGSAMPSATMPGRDGYAFGGYWTETNGGGTQYYNSDGSSTRNWDSRTITTLYAKWTARNYTVNLEDPPTTTPVTVTFDAALSAITPPTKMYYTFDGYWTDNDDTGATLDKQLIDKEGNWKKSISPYTGTNGDNATWIYPNGKSLYAKWDEDLHDVTIAVYPADAGVVQVSGETVSSVSDVGYVTHSPVLTAVPTNAAWVFKEWRVSDETKLHLDLTNYSLYGENMEITATDDGQTLTAVFEPRYYLVGGEITGTGDGGSGTESGMPGWGNYNKPFNLVTNSPILATCSLTLGSNKNFYIMVRDKADGLSYGKSGGTSLGDDASITFTDKDNKVLFYSNGGTNYTFKITAVDGSGRPTVSVERPHQMHFAHKRVDIDGNDYNDDLGGTLTATINSESAIDEQWFDYGSDVAWTATAETGYSLTWYTDNAYSNAMNPQPDASWNDPGITHDENIYAKFTEKTTTVSLENDGHGKVQIGGVDKTGTTVGVTTTRSLTAVPNDGYAFKDWSKPSGDDITLSSTSANPTTLTGVGAGLNEGQRVYASFSEIARTITASAGTGGTVGAASYTAYIDTKADISATPATGYKFKEWQETGGTSNVTFDDVHSASTKIKATGDATIQAVFEPRWAIAGSWKTYPESAAWDADTYKLGNIGTNGSSKDTCYVEITIPANANLTFKIVDRGADGTVAIGSYVDYGNNTTATQYMTYNNHTNWGFGLKSSGYYDCGITTTGGGAYKFVFNITDKSLTVTYPTSYQSNFGWKYADGAGTLHDGDNGGTITVTASDGGSHTISSGQWVAAGASITYTASPAVGYAFAGWHTDDTYGTWFSNDNPWTNSDIKAASNAYAKFVPVTVTYNDESGDGKWSTASNWSPACVPTIDHDVVITKPVTVDIAHATAKSIVLDQNSHTGKLTIQANKGLEVAGTITRTTDGSNRLATRPEDLILESSSAGNASLIFNNSNSCKATVQMYSIGDIVDANTWNWQFMGTPFTSANALYSYYGSYLYEWKAGGYWDAVANGGTMTPFTGYCITQDGPTTYVMDGTLNPNDDVEIDIPASLEFVMANSWTAPISVHNFTSTTLPLDNKTIYLFNTGFAPKESGDAEQGTAAGTYIAMPINSAIYTGNYLIAPMEGFYVDNRGHDAATITLKYNELVRPQVSRDIVAGAMHAPKRAVAAENEPAVMKIKATGSRYSERIVILEREDFSAGFDNGWDGKNLNEPGVAPILYALREDGTKDAVSAIPTYEGTVVGFRIGEDNNYTFSFNYDGEDIWYLNDLKEEKSTLIDAANTYSFVAEAGDAEARFIISATPIQKLPTGIGNDANDAMVKVRKLIINDQLFIIRAGRMYNAVGSIVK